MDNFSFVERWVEEIIYRLLSQKEYVEFLVGRDGDFDQIVSSTIRRMKKNYRDDNCAHICVLPYPKAEYTNNISHFEEYYDKIDVYTAVADTYYKGAFQKRNRQMIDNSDLIVFFVEHARGGAYQALQYAMRMKKKTINICELD